MAQRGRPRRTDEWEIKQDVLLALAKGVPLTVASRRHGVQAQTIRAWGEADEEFAEALAAARSLGWDSLAVECLEIADDARNDYMANLGDDGEAVGYRFCGENVLRSRLRIETRIKLLRSRDNGTYGDAEKKVKVEATVTQVRRHVIDPRMLDDAGRAALRALIDQAARAGLLPAPEVDERDGKSDPLGAPSGFGGAELDPGEDDPAPDEG